MKKISGPLACVADSSFLVTLSDKDHSAHEDAQFLGEKFGEYNPMIFVSETDGFQKRAGRSRTLIGHKPRFSENSDTVEDRVFMSETVSVG